MLLLLLLLLLLLYCSPGAWWRFAIESVSEVIRENQKRLSLDFILRRARQSVLYVSAYTSHLTQSVISEDTRRILEENEIELNYEELVILRRVAMHRIEKERALAEVSVHVHVFLHVHVFTCICTCT